MHDMADSRIEARPKARREVMAGKYLVQYASAAISIASTVPLIEAVGTGSAGTIGSFEYACTPVDVSDHEQVQYWLCLQGY